ncbi:MAG TPA: class I SAM-dependent methyltransferase [Burkholderiales bacterium]|nr:class I SAM-dependent methyltransferase [Burkholderiales bacterium]
MTFSRANPSPRYRALLESYRTMHAEGEKFMNVPPAETFPGFTLLPEAHHIKRLIDRTGALNVLDYGSGKGRQYDARGVRLATGEVVESIVDYWGVDYVHCYDPSLPKYWKLPEGRFHGVISTDVLEHCPEDDLPWIVAEMFAYAERFLYATVACFPAKKRLPSGENAHCTIRPPAWWEDLFQRVAASSPGIYWELSASVRTADGAAAGEERLKAGAR